MTKQYEVEAKIIISTFAPDADEAEADLRDELDTLYPDAKIEIVGVTELG
jgi:hypothetical protein